MASGAMRLAAVTVSLDALLTDWLTLNLELGFTGGAEGASSLLGAIAGSMITIAGVVFSMTLVALSLASSQPGPRLLLAVVSVGVLIFFIHHVSISIQANEIVACVGKDLIAGIQRLFPENIGQGAPLRQTEAADAEFLEQFEREAQPVESTGDGYLQFIDGDALMTLTMQEDLVIRLLR